MGERSHTKNNKNQLVLVGVYVCVWVCEAEAVGEEVGTGFMQQPVISQQTICMCVCRGDNHMGLSHVLFTAVNGSRHWGPLPFTLRPLGDGGWRMGLYSWCERGGEYSANGVLSQTSQCKV